MKRIVLLFLVVACGGGTTTGNDAGGDSGQSDGSTSDAASDGAGDAVADSPANDATSGGDSGLGAGELCDPQNNECQSGLLCCSEPTHLADASTAYFCEKPVNNGCPLFP